VRRRRGGGKRCLNGAEFSIGSDPGCLIRHDSGITASVVAA
jgi:hypothetical protein